MVYSFKNKNKKRKVIFVLFLIIIIIIILIYIFFLQKYFQKVLPPVDKVNSLFSILNKKRLEKF